MSAPEVIEYVLVPVSRDDGEIELRDEDGDPITVEVGTTDIGAGITVVLAPPDLPSNQAGRLMDLLKKKQRESNGSASFVLLMDGTKDVPRWDFVRLVRKDKWDADFGEERAG